MQRIVSFLGLTPESTDKILRRAKRLSLPQTTTPATATTRLSKFGKKRKKKKKATDPLEKNTYWSVYRNESFRYNEWMRTITQEALDKIQSVAQCKEAINMMGYPKVNAGVTKYNTNTKMHTKTK